MPEPENPPEPVSNLQSFFGFLQEMLVGIIDFFTALWTRAGNLAQTNYEFGRRLMSRGELMDATLRFRIALWFDPRHMQAWYHLGQCELARSRRTEAIDAFRRAHALNPTHEETRYMLGLIDPASIMQETPPTHMPLTLVMTQFDMRARDYSISQERQGYRGHLELTEAIIVALGAEMKDLRILDLGCGSGLLGPLLRPRAAELIGVDASQGMLREAALLRGNDGQPIYNHLIRVDLQDYLNKPQPQGFDVIVAANVLGYVGDLEKVFNGVEQVLTPGGLFGFSINTIEQPGFAIVPSLGRFGHSPDYVRALAAHYGWQEVSAKDVMLYPREKALQCVFKKIQ